MYGIYQTTKDEELKMSTIANVSRVERKQFQPTKLTPAQVQQRVQLFTGDKVDTKQTIRTEDGKRIELPANDPEQFQAVGNFYSQATPEGQTRLAQAGNDFVNSLVASKGKLETEDTKSTFVQSFAEFIDVTNQSNEKEATNGMIMMGLAESQTDIKRFAQDLKGNIESKRAKREEISDVRETISDYPKGWSQVGTTDDGKPILKTTFTYTDEEGVTKTKELDKEGALGLVKTMESQLSTIGDMTQEMQLNLEQALQKEQQFYQLISNIMKIMNDTAKSIIQNVK